MNAIKTYILAPNFDIPAEGPYALQLGHFIFDPTMPNIALNEHNVLSFPKDLLPVRMVKPGWAGTISQLRAKKFGIWARFLELVGLGGEISVNSSHGSETYFTFENLETTYFDPELQYVHESINSAGVKQILEAGRYKKPMYMITALKIAREASGIGSETVGRGLRIVYRSYYYSQQKSLLHLFFCSNQRTLFWINVLPPVTKINSAKQAPLHIS